MTDTGKNELGPTGQTGPEPITDKGQILRKIFYNDPAYPTLLFNPNTKEGRKTPEPLIFSEKPYTFPTDQPDIQIKGIYSPRVAIDLLVDLISKQLVARLDLLYNNPAINPEFGSVNSNFKQLMSKGTMPELFDTPLIKQAMATVKQLQRDGMVSINEEVYQNQSLRLGKIPKLDVVDIVRVKALNAAWIQCQIAARKNSPK